MRRFFISMLSCLGLSVCLASPTLAQNTPEPGLTIAAVRFSGPGCPQSDELRTAALNVSDDLLAFTGTLNRMLAETRGTEASSTSCDVEIDFVAPDGVVAELRSVHFRGYSQLREDRKAELITRYSLDGERTRTFKHALTAADQDYVFSDQVPVLLAEVCGGIHTLHLHLELNIAPGSADAGSALVTLDSLDSDRMFTRSISMGECKAP